MSCGEEGYERVKRLRLWLYWDYKVSVIGNLVYILSSFKFFRFGEREHTENLKDRLFL